MVLTQKYGEDEFASYCQIIKVLNSKRSLNFDGDFNERDEQQQGSDKGIHLALYVKSLERIRIVNLREINAAENERFSQMLLGRGREHFPIKVVDCKVFKDIHPSPIPEEDRPTPQQVQHMVMVVG